MFLLLPVFLIYVSQSVGVIYITTGTETGLRIYFSFYQLGPTQNFSYKFDLVVAHNWNMNTLNEL